MLLDRVHVWDRTPRSARGGEPGHAARRPRGAGGRRRRRSCSRRPRPGSRRRARPDPTPPSPRPRSSCHPTPRPARPPARPRPASAACPRPRSRRWASDRRGLRARGPDVGQRQQALEQGSEHRSLGLRPARPSPRRAGTRPRPACRRSPRTTACPSPTARGRCPERAAPCTARGRPAGPGQPEHPGMRSVPLVRRGRERIAAERADVDRPVRREVHRVDEDPSAGAVRGLDDRGHVRNRPERVGRRR